MSRKTEKKNADEVEILEWNYQLQAELEKLTMDQFNKLMRNKGIKYEGKVYIVQEEKPATKTKRVRKTKTDQATSLN